jgi:hypothetical protein
VGTLRLSSDPRSATWHLAGTGVRMRPCGVDLDHCRANGHPSSPIGFRTHAVVFTFAGVRMPRHHYAPASPCRHRWRPSLFPASWNLCVPASCKIPASCRRHIGRGTGCYRCSIHIGESPRALDMKSPRLQYHSLIQRRDIDSVLRCSTRSIVKPTATLESTFSRYRRL